MKMGGSVCHRFFLQIRPPLDVDRIADWSTAPCLAERESAILPFMDVRASTPTFEISFIKQ